MYNDRIIQVEKSSFTPLVFSTSGGMGKEAETLHKRLVKLISEKRGTSYRGRLQRTSAKISDFQTTPPPSPCPGVSEFPKPLPGRPRPDFSFFTHFSIFTHFYFCSLKQSLLPNSCFHKVKMLNTITFRE